MKSNRNCTTSQYFEIIDIVMGCDLDQMLEFLHLPVRLVTVAANAALTKTTS